LGGGATAFLPRIRFNDELATINDERYDPVIWTYQFHAGIGCRFSVTRWFDVMPVILVNYYPNVDLENYAQALHGTKSPGLTNAAAFLKPEFSLFFCFRMGQGKEN
jgi:hypothetical protein